jgi:Ca2+ transporting ATPase
MAAGSRYGISLKQLRELMEFRGREGVEKIKEYGGVHEIASKLQTSEKSGQSFAFLSERSLK